MYVYIDGLIEKEIGSYRTLFINGAVKLYKLRVGGCVIGN